MRKNNHPAVQLIYFLILIVLLIKVNHPVFIIVSYITGFWITVSKKGVRALIFNSVATIAAAAYIFFYAGYNHFGVTVLRENFIGNSITLEAVAKGAAIGFTAVSLVFWAECFHLVFTADKIGFLVSGISKSAKQFIAISLRCIPQASAKSRQIKRARKGIGKGFESGNIISFFKEIRAVVSINIDCFINSLFEKSISMKSRGFSLKSKTSYSKYSFTALDRIIFVFIVLITVVISVGFHLGELRFDFAPIISFEPVSGLGLLNFIAFAALCGAAFVII